MPGEEGSDCVRKRFEITYLPFVSNDAFRGACELLAKPAYLLDDRLSKRPAYVSVDEHEGLTSSFFWMSEYILAIIVVSREGACLPG